MTYIYDILLNFNSEFYEFYDWNKTDKIIHIKKIPIYKVDNKVLEDILYNKVKIKSNFLELIRDKTEVFYKHEIGKIKYSCLLYNLEKIVALNIDEDGKIIGFSDLLIDEYTEIIETLGDLKYAKIEYDVLEIKKLEHFKTRTEKLNERFIFKTLNKLNDEQLQYIYYEIFLDTELDKTKIMDELLKIKHKENLYNLVKCMVEKYKKIK